MFITLYRALLDVDALKRYFELLSGQNKGQTATNKRLLLLHYSA